MTNYQTPIITEIKTRLTALGTLKLVGEYPEDNEKFGAQYPVAFVIDGEEDFEANAANQLDVGYNVSIFFSVQSRILRIKTVTDLQAAIITAIMDGNNLSGLAGTVDLLNIEKGDYYNDLDKFAVGYNESKTNRKINFRIGVCNYAY